MVRLCRRNFNELKSTINIVPLLDVLLVLLLFFMATVPVITQNVAVDLPDAIDKSPAIEVNKNPMVIIEVSGIGQYSMVVEKGRMDQLLFEQVVTEVQQRLITNPKTIFLIGGAKNVPYNEIIKALRLLRSMGVSSVGLMTKST